MNRTQVILVCIFGSAVLILLGVIAVQVSTDGYSNPPQTLEVSITGPTVSAQHLWDEYDAHSYRADEKYRQYPAWSVYGTVTSFDGAGVMLDERVLVTIGAPRLLTWVERGQRAIFMCRPKGRHYEGEYVICTGPSAFD